LLRCLCSYSVFQFPLRLLPPVSIRPIDHLVLSSNFLSG
jgi:hypothetical protein